MGKSRAERTWPRPALTRHVWVRTAYLPGDPGEAQHQQQPPDQGLILEWRRHEYAWQALCVLVCVRPGRDPVVLQRWVSSTDLRPVPADPNRAFGLR